MQVTIQDKKKQWIYVAVIVLSFGVMGWLWFGRGGPDIDTNQVQDALLGGPVTAGSVQSTLPYGTRFDTSVLQSENFKNLVPTQKLQVYPEEIGRSDPFARTELPAPPGN